MRNLIAIYYYTLFEPELLSIELQKLDKKFLYFNRFFIAFLISASVLLLKETLRIKHFFLLMFLSLLVFGYILLFSKMINFLLLQKISNIEKFQNLESFSQFSRNSNSLLELSWLPFIFLVHFAIISNYFQNPAIYLFGFFILLIWQFYILLKGIQYHFEWEIKKTMQELLKGIGIQFFSSIYLFIFLMIIVAIFIT